MADTACCYSRETLAAEAGVSPRQIKSWLREGLLSPGHGVGRWTTYDDTHLAEIKALLALRDLAPRQHELAAFLREEGITVRDYLRRRDAEARQRGLLPA